MNLQNIYNYFKNEMYVFCGRRGLKIMALFKNIQLKMCIFVAHKIDCNESYKDGPAPPRSLQMGRSLLQPLVQKHLSKNYLNH